MSKRHAASRRRSYGRRQHEVAERRDRDLAPERADASADEFGFQAEFGAASGVIAVGELRSARALYASGG